LLCPHVMRLASVLLLPLAATGCLSKSYPASLEDVDDLRIRVEAVSTGGDAVSELTIRITGDDECIRAAPGFVAFMTGIGERRVYAGDDSADFCDTPSIFLGLTSAAQLPSQVLRVSDESLEVVIELGDLLVPRTAVLAEPADGVVLGGAPLAIAWAPATRLDETFFHAELSQLTVPLDADAAGTLRGAVPGTIPGNEAPTLRVIGELDGPLACSNADCAASVDWRKDLAVQLAP
jgi:hypothetical protein